MAPSREMQHTEVWAHWANNLRRPFYILPRANGERLETNTSQDVFFNSCV